MKSLMTVFLVFAYRKDSNGEWHVETQSKVGMEGLSAHLIRTRRFSFQVEVKPHLSPDESTWAMRIYGPFKGQITEELLREELMLIAVEANLMGE